ncbi:hypothetical protein PPYR_06239 [Photinus pyralis]|uniref:Uncharacterized protein n=1 Tax=Photinus pyralis TaxID=7054 RepID=A0A1Y1LSB4_PHOPY|nr:putative methyltransferase C9orf114 homolog [Photinus pyralis]KAB0800499.1 hypothetical protein PPYR_06239 [Photinus pyralis]
MAPIKERKKHDMDITKTERKRWKEKKLLKSLEKHKKEKIPVQESEIPPKLKELSTVSIALPGSILENAQSPALRSYLAGQIARAACIYRVDEIIVFDDGLNPNARKSTISLTDGVTEIPHCCVQLARTLQYLECPQYLRKFFFPVHDDLQYAGLLNPLDAPHHLRQNDVFLFREGVVTTKPVKEGEGSIVNVGLLQDVHVDKLLTAGLRCTVELLPQNEGQKKQKGLVVPPSSPCRKRGVYWGYTVRIATSLSQVFSQSPYKKGYDLTIGTSDKGSPVKDFTCPRYRHLLVTFGGLQGLEAALESDDSLKVDEPQLLFDHYLNVAPNQASRIIRTEEAILITLARLQPLLNPKRDYIQTQTVD